MDEIGQRKVTSSDNLLHMYPYHLHIRTDMCNSALVTTVGGGGGGGGGSTYLFPFTDPSIYTIDLYIGITF